MTIGIAGGADDRGIAMMADGGPSDQLSDVLGHHRSQRLGGGGQAQLGHVQQQPAGPAQTGVSAIAAIEMGR